MALALAIVTSLKFSRESSGGSRYVSAKATPGPAQRAERSARMPAIDAVTGDAPWALSALPECFRQLRSARGSPAFAEAKIPARARRLPSGTIFFAADCALQVGRNEVRVERGSERLRIPPQALLFSTPGGRLVLERRDGRRADVRVYAPAAGSRVRLP